MIFAFIAEKVKKRGHHAISLHAVIFLDYSKTTFTNDDGYSQISIKQTFLITIEKAKMVGVSI